MHCLLKREVYRFVDFELDSLLVNYHIF